MRHDFVLALKSSVGLHQDGEDLILAGQGATGLRLHSPRPAVKALIENLGRGGNTGVELCDQASRENAGVDIARLYFILEAIGAKGFIRYTLAPNGRDLATLEPVSPSFRFEDAPIEGKFRLSRFACLRRVENETLLESPLGHAVVILHDQRAAAATASLSIPRTVAEIATELDVPSIDAAAFLSLLTTARAVFPCDAEGRIAEDETVPLRQWEFHDLLFHSRSRMGRHEYPYGGTFRFAGDVPPLPAIKKPMSERRVALARPDMAALDRTDVPFSRVLEARRSVRTRADTPISAAQLGEFLYRVARVKAVHAAAPENDQSYESSERPCASGGAMHEIELYLTITRCDGIEPGLYHYAPLAHELEHVTDLGTPQKRLVADACGSAGLESPPDILITLAARFQRVAWKYEAMAYAVILKNAGALYQQMYLVATAMNLAPCGLGGGDSDAFAEAAGLDYYCESSVGEFMLSGR